MLRFMGSQRARHDWAAQLKWGPCDIAHCPCDMEALCVCVYACVLSCFSCVQLCNPMDCSPPKLFCPWGFSGQEYWSGLPCPPGDLPNPGIEPLSLMSPASAGGFFATGATWEACLCIHMFIHLIFKSLHILQLYTHPLAAALSSSLKETQQWLILQPKYQSSPGKFCPYSQWGSLLSPGLLNLQFEFRKAF